MPKIPIAPDLIRSALARIPANLIHDDWVKILAAIKSEFPSDTGFDLAEQWSSTADNFNAKSMRDTWKSIKAVGGVTIGTLLFMAKEQGFVLPKAHQAAATPDPAAAAQRDRDRAENQRIEKARTEAAHASAASEAAALWEDASERGESAYLTRKRVQAYGVRVTVDGWLLVPMVDAAGKLWNVQRIAPSKPSDGTDKFYGPPGVAGSRKSGLWHMLGTVASDPATAGVLLIAEGYATAASLHEATGQPVAVAFDVGNIATVSKELRQLYPMALLVLCGDDDLQTFKDKGKNPGRAAATAAAHAVRGVAVFPDPLPEGCTDFNDMHQASGLDAVRRVVKAAIDAHQAAQTAAQAATADQVGTGGRAPKKDASGAPAGNAVAFDPFSVSDDGVWHQGIDQDGKQKSPEWVCSRLDVDALTRDQDGGGWGYLLAFADPLGNAKQWAMPARMLSGDGGEYRSTLLNMGLRIAPSPRARNLLTQYIQTRVPDDFASCTDRVGWHNGRSFVLPRETIGDSAERIVFQSDNAVENTFRIKGTTEQWRERIGALCVGNSRLAFAVASAFAGPLLRPAGMESGGFHYRGDSSSGKTTALKVAASVYGGASYLQRWRATDNALEAIAAQHSDCLLLLDELAQIDPKTAGECAYMLANEQGKARATRTGTPRARQSWRLLFLSAGEQSLAGHMAEGMKRTHAGQETRMADIPADAGAGMGAFENLHGHDGGSLFARHLAGQAASIYGAPGRAWLHWLCDHADTIKASIRTASAALAVQMIPESAAGQVERVGARFALVGAAGELATAAGLTGWLAGESERAAKACFNAWLASRGGIGNGEVVAMLRQARSFLETNGESRFTLWHRTGDDRNAKTLNRAGMRRVFEADGSAYKDIGSEKYDIHLAEVFAAGGSVHYYVLPEAFKNELCRGFDAKTFAAVLASHGCLTMNEANRHSIKTKLPGIGATRCYVITPKIFELDL